MRRVKIQRGKSTDQGTSGLITTDSGKSWFTLELPWLDNKSGVSCIPAGEYKVLWTKSPRLHKYTYEIVNVPGRGGIRMHSGNFAGSPPYLTHSLGCPLIGCRVGVMNKQLAILGSKIAVMMFENEMERKPFILEIKDGTN